MRKKLNFTHNFKILPIKQNPYYFRLGSVLMSRPSSNVYPV